MSLKDFDYLSQEISLFFYGRTRHSSYYGGILTIIMLFLCAIYIFYLILEVYLHRSSTIQYYRHFFKNPGIYSFNDTQGIFHFFHIYNTKDKNLSFFNSKYIRLFMANNQEEYKTNSELLLENEHWVYDQCREGVDNKNLSKELFEDVSFENGLCLRYYYNHENKLYFPIEDIENFKYPYLTNLGIKNEYTIGTVIEKCNNNSVLTKLFGPCGNKEEMQKFFNQSYGINLNILTNEIRPGIYNQQIYNFIYGVSNSLKKNKTIENKVYFTPLLTFLNDGIIFTNKNENQTYTFSEIYSDDKEIKEDSGVLSVYNFYLSQSGYIFKSTYQTIYDSLPKIGGITQLIYYLFFGINYIFNKFTVIDDTKKLFFTLHNDEKKNGMSHIKKFSKIVQALRHRHFLEKSSTEKIKKIIALKRNSNNNYYESNIKFKLAHNYNEEILQKNIDIDNSKSLSIFPFVSDRNIRISLYNKKNLINNSDLINDEIDKNKINININKKVDKSEAYKTKRKSQKSVGQNYYPINVFNNNFNHNNIKEDKEITDFKMLLKKYFNFKKKRFLYEKMTVDKIDHFFTIRKYIASLLCYKKPKYYYLALEFFRKKLLSEEHFFRTHNFLYLFEKCFDLQESKKIDIIELYKNL